MTDNLLSQSLADNNEACQDWQQSGLTQQTTDYTGEISHYVNGKGLACPLPLLKLKMALRTTDIGNHVYVTATDPNSQRDIGAFCQHAGHTLLTATHDTIIHLLITKNC